MLRNKRDRKQGFDHKKTKEIRHCYVISDSAYDIVQEHKATGKISKSEAAEILGINPSTLWRKMKRYEGT